MSNEEKLTALDVHSVEEFLTSVHALDCGWNNESHLS